MTDLDLEAIKARLTVQHYEPGPSGTEEHVGEFVHLSPAERDALVAEVERLRAVLGLHPSGEHWTPTHLGPRSVYDARRASHLEEG